MLAGEDDRVLALVLRGFDEFVRPDFPEDGVAEFTRTARALVLERPAAHSITVAVDGNAVVGMIDVRDCSHVSLFFVEAGRQGGGVGRALLEHAIGCCLASSPATTSLTVNSSRWAVPVYGRLGFVAAGPESERNGIRSTPMVRELPANADSSGESR
jgi:GNAT superfamily N-acetyltransferase